jgi:hypothetical protein
LPQGRMLQNNSTLNCHAIIKQYPVLGNLQWYSFTTLGPVKIVILQNCQNLPL